MGLFAKCVICGKTKLSSSVDRGVCSDCYAKMLAEEADQQEQAFDVSALVQPAAAGYTPPPTSSDEPVYVVIDVETTGLDPVKDAIVQVSALRFFGKKMIDGLNSYINPHRPIPAKAAAIHGITDETVKGAPAVSEIREPFLNFIRGAIVVGYNVTFDLNFLNCAFHGALAGVQYIDVMEIARTLLALPNYRLETVAEYAEFCPEGGYHDALNDCTATAAVFFRLGFDKPGLAKEYRFKTPAKQDRAFSQKDIAPSAVPADPSHPLYGKRIVFTGDLSIGRYEAAQMAADVGALIRSTVSGKTDYLVVGAQDPFIISGGMSGKEEKAYELNDLGKAHIQIIHEREFMALLEGTVRSNTNGNSPVQ